MAVKIENFLNKKPSSTYEKGFWLPTLYLLTNKILHKNPYYTPDADTTPCSVSFTVLNPLFSPNTSLIT